ncbi:MAG: HlyD family type I secretion periplasmic adaptor subunit [Rhodocyclaceae bacterium]|nr:HlyD family type I secretion periplasmic adaptor subunit [Rhodocyclaceae bacterium]MDZ4215271.1 HlyD family type I secretion periplasmic adaptor subunit [Rhodocyclaceae bacterium]
MPDKVSTGWRRLFARASQTKHPPTDHNTTDLDNEKSLERAIAFGQRIILYGVVGFLAWASLAPIDEGAVASGSIVVESGRKTITPLVSGLIAQLNISENQSVKSGEVLLTLDDAQQKATLNSALQQYFAVTARLARLQAELAGNPALEMPADLALLDNEPWARELLMSETRLLESRNDSHTHELGILRERIAASENRAQGARQQLNSRRQQIDLLDEQIRGLKKLVDAGHTPRNQLLETQRVQVEVVRLASELETTINIATNNSAELRLQQAQRRREIQRDIEASIIEASRERATLQERTNVAKDEFERTVLKAPIDGQVVSLQGLAPGSAVTQGSALMDIIPEGDRLLVDVQVAPHLIDRIHPGLTADVRINAFPDEPQLIVAGQVRSLARDQMRQPSSGQAYYLARIEITPEGLATLGSRQLRPGMPVEAIIKTGERSFLAYLFKPITQRMFSAFREN